MKNLIVIVGVGALGSHVAQFLRGEGDLKVIDFDRVETKNTLAQFHAKSAIGRNKAEALKQTMQFLWGVKINAVPHRLAKENVSALLDSTSSLIIDCLDNGPSRRLIQERARSSGVATLHGALAADGQFARVMWDEQFTVDDGAVGAPTCEGGEHLPFIATVSGLIARAAQLFLREGKKVGYVVHPGGVERV